MEMVIHKNSEELFFAEIRKISWKTTAMESTLCNFQFQVLAISSSRALNSTEYSHNE